MIYTIGYGNDESEAFVERLRNCEIDAVWDVRSNPVASYNQDYSRSNLMPILADVGFKYEFLGDALGGKPRREELLTNGQADFEKMRAWAEFQEAIEALLQEGDRSNVCLMCACADPENCHRGTLLCEVLLEQGVDVLHIQLDGELKHHSLVRLAFQPSLF